jgi:hypothetical protein
VDPWGDLPETLPRDRRPKFTREGTSDVEYAARARRNALKLTIGLVVVAIVFGLFRHWILMGLVLVIALVDAVYRHRALRRRQ